LVSVRLTAQEKERLVEEYGSASRGMRLMVDAHFGDVVVAAVEPKPVEVHRHRRGAVVRTEFRKGTEVKVYLCSGCGEELG
jgi:hypothetical protein